VERIPELDGHLLFAGNAEVKKNIETAVIKVRGIVGI
jgi:hypothetical protein